MDNIFMMDQTIGHKGTNKFGDIFFSNLNPITFNKFNSLDVFEAEFAKTLFRDDALYIIIGTDSGLLPKYIINKKVPESSRYLFIEPERILNELRYEDVLPNHEHIAYADEKTWLTVADEFKINDYIYINSVTLHRSFCVKMSTVTAYAELSWFIDEKLRQFQYEVRSGIMMEQFFIQQILNLSYNQNPLSLLEKAFKGKTAFVLGGGPSLDDALPWIIEHRKSIVLIAVSRISKRLLEVGLEPDLFVSVDPGVTNIDVSKDIFSFSAAPIFINSHHVYYELLSQWPGRSFYLGERVPWESKLNSRNISGWGPTVTNTAISIALYLGFNRIFLAGVDFAYTLDGFTHAKGSIEHKAGARFNLTGVEVETYAGVMAPTGLDYAYARDKLEQQIQNYIDSGDYHVFNCSLMAAKVKGIEHHPIASISIDKETVPVDSIVTNCLSNNADHSYLALVDKEINQLLFQLKAIKQVAKEALECNETMYSDEGQIHHKQKVRLGKLEKLLKQKYKKYSTLVKGFGIREFLKMTKPFDADHLTAEDIKLRLRIYYQSYLDGANRLIALLHRTAKISIACAEELKKQPNWDLIIDNARVEECFGRVRIWKELDSAKNLSKEYKLIFEEFEGRFQEASKTLKSPHESEIKHHSDLSVLNQKARSLFEHNKVEQLKNLVSAVDKHVNQEEITPYRHLILGYIAELEKKPEQALEEYQSIIGLGTGPLERALLRIVVLVIDKGEAEFAHQAFECLAQIKERYLAFYAESCQIHGDYLAAINAYSEYILSFPGDVLVQLKLAQLYINQKIYEKAESLLNDILIQSPKNQTAISMQKQMQELIATKN
jgi:hypothetical protein